MISSGSKILIFGDSWGCGEWSGHNNPYHVTHLGLEYYLREYGCEVTNLSKGGESNLQMISELRNNLVSIDFSYDYIFWFQTDPIRDLRPYDQATFPKNVKDLLQKSTTLLTDTYRELNSLGVTIHCMGGTTNLLSSIEDYPNLTPFIPSIVKMFNGPNIDFWISDWIQAENLRFSDSFLSELEAQSNPKLPIEWFFPDGSHPNRKAHRKIFEYILSQHK
jgi:hypothetical protein